MSFRVMFATVVMGVLLVVGAGPAIAKKHARVHKHHRIVALTATGRAPHSWRLDKALAPASTPRSFVAPFPSGFKCGVYVGYATNNNPREETTFDSVQQGFQFPDGHGGVGGVADDDVSGDDSGGTSCPSGRIYVALLPTQPVSDGADNDSRRGDNNRVLGRAVPWDLHYDPYSVLMIRASDGVDCPGFGTRRWL